MRRFSLLPGEPSVALAKAVRMPRSTTVLVPRKTAPSRAPAAITLPHEASRCSLSGGSSSSKSAQTCSKSFLPRKPAIRPPITLNGMKRNFIAGKVYPRPSAGTRRRDWSPA
jgi:hypothetical protein